MRPIITLFILISGGLVRSEVVISPFVAGDSASALPFLTHRLIAPSVRYQQVYGASDFFSRVAGLLLITEISFAPGPGTGPIDVQLPSLHVNLSTTQKAPDGLSSTFSDNLGPNDSLVYSGSIRLTIDPTGDLNFPVHIPLQHPFLFDPRAGNLLMDVRNFETQNSPPPPFPQNPPLFEAQDRFGDTLSFVASFDVNSPSANIFVQSEGLVTEFTVTPVPEPGSIWLVASACAAWLLSLAARRSRDRGRKSL